MHGLPGYYKICWVHQRAFETINVGTITVAGPVAKSVECILGERCTVTLAGTALLDTDGARLSDGRGTVDCNFYTTPKAFLTELLQLCFVA